MTTKYSVKLKAPAVIRKMCDQTENGEQGQDGIAYDADVLKLFKGSSTLIESFVEYDDGLYAVYISKEGVGKTYVHPEWVSSIYGMPVAKGWYEKPTKYVKTTEELSVCISSNEIVETYTLPTCSCGAVVTDGTPEGYEPLCDSCVEKLTELKFYSFTPSPLKFKGEQLRGDEDTPLHFGIEIETACDRTRLAHFMTKHKDDVYLKADSSIRGDGYRVEIVSVPHTFKALMAKDSYLHTISMLGAKEHEENGLHIHISRTVFKDDKHYGMFYFLLHEMEKVSIHVGGRDLTSYCKLTPTGRIYNKGNKANNSGSRTVYLNECNEKTVEARFFLGTTDTDKLKARVQYLESLIKYTKYHSKTVTASGWFAYISKKSGKYAELLKYLKGYDTSSLSSIKVVFSPPKQFKIKPMNLKVGDLKDIVVVVPNVGDEMVVNASGSTALQLRTRHMRFSRVDYGGYEIDYSEIDYVIVER